MAHEHHHRLLEALQQCAAECNHCTTACLEEQDVKMMARCIKLDIDCAAICMLAAGYVARGSEHMRLVLQACAAMCDACADECDKHAHHMDHCKACATACRQCAEACRQLV